MMELFQQYNVEFVSSTEKFDTSTPMGRAMLNICIVFAQLERETIQKRVTDAYYSRSQRGFKMGGKAPYGFHTEPIKMDGINTKKLVVNPEEAANIRLMFEMYAQPTTSYGDITRYFAEQGILFHGKELIRPTLAQMLRNPVYVQADLDVYEFSKVKVQSLSMTLPIYGHERLLSVSRARCKGQQEKRLKRPNAGTGSP